MCDNSTSGSTATTDVTGENPATTGAGSGTKGKRMVAVAGKGGTGKTASVAMMARALMDNPRTGSLLLIDADPACGLLSALGVEVRRSMGEVREEIIRTARRRDNTEPDAAAVKQLINEKIDYLSFEALTEFDDFAVIAMGRTETMGCYCPVNSLLRESIKTLSKGFDTILIDGEAGLEQVNRQVVKRLQTLMVISDPTSRGIETAAALKALVEGDRAMEVERLGLVFNRVRGAEDVLESRAAEIGLDLFGFIPFDETIAEYDLVGKAITDLPDDAPSLMAYRKVVDEQVLV
jgi:CO dehydrogenase maturation factor